MNNSIFGKCEECEKTERYQTSNSQRKKELISARTKLLYSKKKFGKIISHRNEKNIYTHQ